MWSAAKLSSERSLHDAPEIIELSFHAHISYTPLLGCQTGLSEVKHVVHFVIVLCAYGIWSEIHDHDLFVSFTISNFNYCSMKYLHLAVRMYFL